MADAVIRWRPSARGTNPVTVLATELNSLSNGAGALSAAISNDASDELDLYMDLELAVTFGSAPNANTAVQAHIVRQIDGTNYEDTATDGRPIHGQCGGFIVQATTNA